MKASTITIYVGAAALAILGVTMAKTNPSQAEYEDYAVQRLTQYLRSDVCKKTQGFIESLINFKCEKIVESISPQMRGIIAGTTKHQDFLIFSVYRTDLKINSGLPSYKFETVAAFNNFYTYSAKEQ